VDDVRLMLQHALTTGRRVPVAWVEAAAAAQASPQPLPADLVRRVGRAHDGLSRLIAPATPRTLKFLEEDKHRKLVLSMSGLSLAFLMCFVALAVDPDVGGRFAEFENSSGHKLFVNLLFQLSAAGLGATFAALFAINTKLRERSLDPREMFSNWVRVLLGLVSGLVLAQLAPVNGQAKEFGRPLLALLGGFSVDVVYRTLKRLVDLAGSIIDAGPGDPAAVERDRVDTREAQVKTALAQQLVRLRATLPDGPATQALDAMLADLTPVDATAAELEPPPPPDAPPPDAPPDAPPPDAPPDVPPDAPPDAPADEPPPDAPLPDPVPDDPDAAAPADPPTARPRRRR
jgi:hypothetical protein